MSYDSAPIYCSKDEKKDAQNRADDLGMNLSEYTRKLWEKEREEGMFDDE